MTLHKYHILFCTGVWGDPSSHISSMHGGVIQALHATTQCWSSGHTILQNGSGGVQYLWNERTQKNTASGQQGGWGSLEFSWGVLECLVGNAILIK
jgi:hypothetical protein